MQITARFFARATDLGFTEDLGCVMRIAARDGEVKKELSSSAIKIEWQMLFLY